MELSNDWGTAGGFCGGHSCTDRRINGYYITLVFSS